MNIPLSVVKYCAEEVERQHVGPLGVYNMCSAWDYCIRRATRWNEPTKPTMVDAMRIANLIEPHENRVRGATTFRVTNLLFPPDAAKPEHILRQMQLLFENFPTKRSSASMEHYLARVEEWTKHLLDIHPWGDGNGRTASLLRNWLRGTLNEPEALPYYYGEQ